METCKAENDHEQIESMKIEQDLERVITEQGTTALFDCIVKGHQQPPCRWYKNGNSIKNCQRIGITSTSINSKTTKHSLKIENVCVSDQGIYTLICQNQFKQLTTKASLFVVNKIITKGVTYYSSDSTGAGVIQHLRNVDVEEGDLIKLEVFFRVPVVALLWFKDNEIIKQNKSKNNKVLKSKKIMTLMVLKSVMADTGIYYVVAKTRDGQVHSSFADVHVTPVYQSTACIDRQDLHRLPIIVEFPCEIGAYQNEQFRLLCRVQHDLNTSIEWYKNGICITYNRNFVSEDYGGQYIGLKKNKADVADSGNYTLTLRDELTDTEESCSCNIIITPTNFRGCAPAVTLRRPLLSAVACVGSKVVFDCSYSVNDPTYFYVVWYVGTYRIERTNSKFSVIYRSGEYLLYIKKLEPEMAGSVVCELRKALPNQRTLQVSSSMAHLAIVPSSIVDDELKNNPHLHRTKLYEEGICPLAPTTAASNTFSNAGPSFHATEESNTNGSGVFDDGDYLDISYSRLDEEWLFFLHASKANRDANVLCHEIAKTNSTLIRWDEALFPNMCWYAIAIGQSDGTYAEAGETSSSVIWTQRPLLETIMKIRVRAVPIPNNDHLAQSLLSIVPPQKDVLKRLRSDKVGTMEDFLTRYTETGDLLGFGAFGSVVLARDEAGNQYAVKIIKLSTKKCRTKAIREYEVMKQIHHSKLIQLVEGFSGENAFVIAMEYLWGGELFDRIVQEEYIREEDVVNYVKQICEALSYLHKLKIAHLDIKPENIVCLSPNSCQVKIIDFGLATVLDGCTKRALYGTRDYMAPEILNFEELTLACDMWSMGVLAYMMLSGQMPFGGSDTTNRETSARITAADYNYNDIAFDDITALAKNFIDKLLVLNTRTRMTAEQALEHEWLQEGSSKEAKGCMKRTRENMKTYLAAYRAKWQRAGHVVIAANRLRTHAVTNRSPIAVTEQILLKSNSLTQ